MNKFRIAVVVAVLALIAALIGVGSMTSANATNGGEQPCVPSDAWTETIEHPAVTHVVHHEGTPATPDLWWNWSPNKDQGPFDGPPAFPTDDRGTWQGPHENGGPDQDTYGTFNSSNNDNGRASWFHRDHGTPGTEPWDEVVVDQEAWTETIEHPAVTCEIPVPVALDVQDPCGPDNASWVYNGDTSNYFSWDLTDDGDLSAHAHQGYVFENGETVIEFGKAVDSGEKCPVDKPDPIVTETSSTSYNCGDDFATVTTVTTTTDYVSDGEGGWVLGDPVSVTTTAQVPHEVVACDTDEPPVDNPPTNNPPVVHHNPPVNPPAPGVPTVVDAGL